MKITLHDESIDIEVGQKVIFYGYHLKSNNNQIEIEVITDETFVYVIDEENNLVVFKNDVHSSTLSFYQNNRLGERFFLSDTDNNKLRYLQSMVKYYDEQQELFDNSINETYKLLERYISRRKHITDNLESVKKLIEQLGEDKDE